MARATAVSTPAMVAALAAPQGTGATLEATLAVAETAATCTAAADRSAASPDSRPSLIAVPAIAPTLIVAAIATASRRTVGRLPGPGMAPSVDAHAKGELSAG